jgi:16S rRNA (cytosine1402-N4)-methyltransferase
MDRDLAHQSVLRDEVAELLGPADFLDRPVTIVDCTTGLGGHSQALLQRVHPASRLIGLDVDEANLRRAKENLSDFEGRVRLFQANFSEIDVVLSEADSEFADIVLADLGIASSQLDDPARGLSFQADGPLDMRLDDRLEKTAADLVNTLSETDLANVIYRYGEERLSRRIARRIVEARKEKSIRRTGELAEIVSRCYPPPARRKHHIHPATRTFQALRIAVNDELGVLETLLAKLPTVLANHGRAGIISFHSLEDRLVKRAFADWATTGIGRVLTKKPVVPQEAELRVNPRSRSAKLRGFERLTGL